MTRFETKPQMAYIVALLLVVLMALVACLAGCSGSKFYGHDANVAARVCKDHGNWDSVVLDAWNEHFYMVTCTDGFSAKVANPDAGPTQQ